MKKIVLGIIIPSLLLAFGCQPMDFVPQVEEDPAPNTENEQPIDTESPAATGFYIKAETGNSQTKVIHGDMTESGTPFDWENGDKLKVLVVQGYNSYHCVGVNKAETGPVGSFLVSLDRESAYTTSSDEWTPAAGDVIYAFYPYEGSDTRSLYIYEEEAYLWTFDVLLGGLVQHGDNNTAHLDITDVMVARPVTLTAESLTSNPSGQEVEMEFRHCLAKIALTVVNNTEESFSVNTLSYVSNIEDDWLAGALLFDVETGNPVVGDSYGITHSNVNTLNVEDITLAPGESAVLWIWMPELDFSTGNAADRKAEILLSTSAGIFQAKDVQFSAPFEAGYVYKQKFTLTPGKKLDPDFVFVPELLTPLESYYWANLTNENGERVAFDVYDHSLNKIDEEHPLPAGGVFVRKSEVAAVKSISLTGFYSSLKGIEAFANLETFVANLQSDNPNLATRSIDLSGNPLLKKISVDGLNTPAVDLSSLSHLEDVRFNTAWTGKIGEIVLPSSCPLISANLQCGNAQDYSRYPTLKTVYSYGADNLSGLELDYLWADDLSLLTGMPAKALELHCGLTEPASYPEVHSLYLLDNGGEAGLEQHLNEFLDLEEVTIQSIERSGLTFAFGPANSKITSLYLRPNGNTVSGIENMPSLASFDIINASGNITIAPEAPLTTCAVSNFSGDITMKDVRLLETLSCSDFSGTLYFGNLPALRNLNVFSPASHAVVFNYDGVTGRSYPALTDITIGDDNETVFPAHNIPGFASLDEKTQRQALGEMLPELYYLNLAYDPTKYLTGGGHPRYYTSISTLDLSPYSKLQSVSVGNMYYSGSTLKTRANGSIKISESQNTYWTANPNWFHCYYNETSTSYGYSYSFVKNLVSIVPTEDND